MILNMSKFVLANIHKINQTQPTGLLNAAPNNKNFYSVYVPGIKKFMRQEKRFVRAIKQIEAELDRSETKRIEIKRKEIKFTKEQTIGYRLEDKSDRGKTQQMKYEAALHDQLIEEANRREFKDIIDQRVWNKQDSIG